MARYICPSCGAGGAGESSSLYVCHKCGFSHLIKEPVCSECRSRKHEVLFMVKEHGKLYFSIKCLNCYWTYMVD